MRTLDPARVLFVDSEAGDLAVQDLPLDTVRVDDWPTARDLACRIGGPNPSFPPTACYSQAHFEAVGGPLENLGRYDMIFVDSITAISRLSFRWAEQQPEADPSAPAPRTCAAPTACTRREMLMWLHQLQHARGKHVVFVGMLERVTDEFNRSSNSRLQMEGAKMPREIRGIVDQIITMEWVDFGDRKPVRAFVCTSPNPWGYPAKDRSGRLEQVEEPAPRKADREATRPGDRKPFDCAGS